MIKTAMKITLTVMIAGLLVSAAYAGPISLNETQMDSITAGRVMKVSAFVCPVILQAAVGEHNPQAGELGDSGTYTVVPATANNGHLWVPVTATNADGNGRPGVTTGPNQQSHPGDTDYTAIWARPPQPPQ
jgi:hypothetical protein